MSERRESGTPVIHDIFPIGKKSATDAAHAIISPVGRKIVTTLSRIFETVKVENPEVKESLFSLLALSDNAFGRDPDRDADFWLGAAYTYEVLTREAQARGGCLPTINPDVIRTKYSDQTSIEDIPLSYINIKDSEIFTAGKALGTSIIRRING